MDVAKATFIPHHTNNHWPLALRHRTLAYTSSFLLLTKAVAIAALAITPHVAQLSTITDGRILQLTNAAREHAGLAPLVVNNTLAQAAKLKGQDMLKNQYFAHISPAGVTPWFWMKKTGYTYQLAGENLAIDFLDAEDAVAAWLASPTHKANMLHAEYTETGIAVVSGEFQGGTSIIIVHMFGKPLAEEEAVAPNKEIEEAPQKQAEPPTPSTLPVPNTPRIALVHSPTNQNDNAIFRIEGDKNDVAVLLIGNIERSITTLSDAGYGDISIAAKDLPTGSLTARVYSRNKSGVESTRSEKVSFVNPKPALNAEPEHVFALSPAFDRLQISLIGSSSAPWQLLSLNSSTAINARPVQVLPSFARNEDEAETSFSISLLHSTRAATSLILITVACLLILAIIVKIRHQHPALIMHASLVIILATALLSW